WSEGRRALIPVLVFSGYILSVDSNEFLVHPNSPDSGTEPFLFLQHRNHQLLNYAVFNIDVDTTGREHAIQLVAVLVAAETMEQPECSKVGRIETRWVFTNQSL